jgi:hypothetical protein
MRISRGWLARKPSMRCSWCHRSKRTSSIRSGPRWLNMPHSATAWCCAS